MESPPENQSGQSPKQPDDLPAKDLQTSQDYGSDTRPQDEPEHHRSEAKNFGILALWILSELIFQLGHEHISVWILAIVTWATLSFFTYHAIKAWKRLSIVLCIVYAALCVAAPIALYLTRSENSTQSTRPAFSIIALETTVELKNPNHFLLWADGDQNNTVIAPIQIVMWVEFTNLKDVPMSISSCQFECKATNGTWVAMQVIDPNIGWLYSTRNGDLHHAEKYDPGQNVFPSAFRSKNINPGVPIDAWVFLEPPKNGFDGNIQFRLKDSADNESVELIGQRSETNMLSNKTLNGPPIYLLNPNDVRDISKARLVDYGKILGGN